MSLEENGMATGAAGAVLEPQFLGSGALRAGLVVGLGPGYPRGLPNPKCCEFGMVWGIQRRTAMEPKKEVLHLRSNSRPGGPWSEILQVNDLAPGVLRELVGGKPQSNILPDSRHPPRLKIRN